MKNNRLLLPFVLGLLLLTSCKSDPFPRPTGYPRIELPEVRSYDTLSSASCPFSFEFPTGGEIRSLATDSCVADIYFPSHDYYWHLTYRNIPESGKARPQHEEEYRRLVYKHSVKLSHMSEFELSGPNGYGTMYELQGKVGTPAQVFYGDSAQQHVFMLSFYFKQAINQDSLRPLIDFVKQDLEHAVATAKFR